MLSKKFLAILVLGFALISASPLVSSVALAKDAPFPILGAKGMWEAKNHPGLFLDLEVGPRVDQGTAVEFKVLLKDKTGQTLAEGKGVHNLDDPNLEVILTDKQGREYHLVMRAGDQAGEGDSGALYMNLEQTGGSTNHYIFGRDE